MNAELDAAWNKMREAFKLMAKRNDVLQDTHGNLSVKVGDDILIKPSGVPYDQITEMCHLKILTNGALANVRNNGLKPSVDLIHHVAIYRDNPDVSSICHTHSPYAVAFAIVGDALECMCTEHADYFGGPIYCSTYRDLDSWGAGLARDPGTKAVLLQHHGALTFADDPMRAVNLAIQLENVARKNFLARQLRASTAPMARKEIKKWHERYNNVYGQR